MNNNFWQTFRKPFFCLAPMEEATDVVFREIVLECGQPDVFFTEFTSVDGLLSPGRAKVAHRLRKRDQEQPIVAQIWGSDPEKFRIAAAQIAEMGFAGVDINMGCPVRKITKQGGCSTLINDKTLAIEIILATIEGATSGSQQIPVSVKTRCGFSKWETEDWARVLLATPIAALTIHGRIAKEMSKFPARWDEIAKVVKIRDELKSGTLIIGNGDIKSREAGVAAATQWGVDGIMIGRGVFENPWVFNEVQTDHSVDERFNLLLKHVQLFDETWGNQKNFNELKRFFKIYVKDFDGASDLRAELMETKNRGEVERVVTNYCKSINNIVI